MSEGETVQDLGERALDAIEKVVVGRRDALRLMLVGILAGGHLLIEDLPGLGKTLMARCMAQALGLEFTRLQFTPDLLPSDITGSPVLDPSANELVFKPGPVFTNLLLADEINRTPPKTQSALLEAMSDGGVSLDGVTHPLPVPFVVLATDNPIEYEGTYALPEAQLDRFLMRVRLGYLDHATEERMVQRRLALGPLGTAKVDRVTDGPGVLSMIASVDRVEVDDDLVGYVVAIVAATRGHRDVQVGASPRGALGLTQAARALALLEGRDFVVPQDVKQMAVPVLGHRITLRPELWVRRVDGDDIVRQIVSDLPTPRTVPS